MHSSSFSTVGFSISVQCQQLCLEKASQCIILFELGAWHNAHNKLLIYCYRRILYLLMRVVFKTGRLQLTFSCFVYAFQNEACIHSQLNFALSNVHYLDNKTFLIPCPQLKVASFSQYYNSFKLSHIVYGASYLIMDVGNDFQILTFGLLDDQTSRF